MMPQQDTLLCDNTHVYNTLSCVVIVCGCDGEMDVCGGEVRLMRVVVRLMRVMCVVVVR